MISTEIKKYIQSSLTELGLPDSEIVLEHPGELSHGDYSTNIALALAKQTKQNPRDLAVKITESLNAKKPEFIQQVETAGPGFINFQLSPLFFSSETSEILAQKEQYGTSNLGKGKKALVEYSSPNIAKPFTVGHLRSTIIGHSVANILAALGYSVIRDNHLGDWGTQFGKMIVALKKWGDFSALDTDQTPIKTLVDLYVKFHDEAEKNPALEDEARETFKRLEDKQPEETAYWQKCIELSNMEFDRVYVRLGVKFDTIHGESFFGDKMAAVLEDIKKAGIARESEGAYLIFFPEDKYPPLMVLKKDGSSLYSLRDLATDKWRKAEYGADLLVINEVGAEQTLYFRQIFETEEMLGYFPKSQRVHVGHGLYRFQDSKMSTRKGNVIWLDEILNEAVTRAGAINPASAEIVGIGAIKFNDLRRESHQDIVFDWDQVLNLKGDSGPYLQYSAVRAKSLVDKAVTEGIMPAISNTEAEVTTLEKLLYRYPEVVERAGAEYAPHTIATYLIDLASAFNHFYNSGKIIDKADPKSPHKVALTAAFGEVMRNGLGLLGISVPEQM